MAERLRRLPTPSVYRGAFHKVRRRPHVAMRPQCLNAERLACHDDPSYFERICSLRLAVQDAALSRLKHGFDSRRERQGSLKPR